MINLIDIDIKNGQFSIFKVYIFSKMVNLKV